MPKVTIYTTPTCPYCHLAKEFFKEHSVDFTEKDVASDEQAREEMVKKSGFFGVPVIEIDNELIVGFDKEKISKLLKI